MRSKKPEIRTSAVAASCRFVGSLLLIIACWSLVNAQDYTRWVNPFIGTGGHGHTFPGATMPFGMVQLSPDTRIDNWDGSSGYHYSDDIIYGFSHTHLSGTGIPDGCDILFMPYVGTALFDETGQGSGEGDFASKFSHTNEKAEPGYYSVRLDKSNVTAEMTATTRVGFHRYSFPKSDRSNILLDLRWRDKALDSELTVVSNRRIEGYRQSSSWAKDQKVYFVAEFSKPFDAAKAESGGYNTSGFHMYRNGRLDDRFNPYKSRDLKAAFQFKTVAGEQILLKVAISYVSIEGARRNLAAELPHWDFDKVRADAKPAWNNELSKIEVSGGTPEQTTNFYTALYHTMIQPNIFEDVDGSYLGHDRKIHNIRDDVMQKPDREGGLNTQRPGKALADARASASHEYTVFSLWDTFRAAHPLYTIIDQKRTVDFINTFIRQYEQGGRLPVWELWGEETDTMIGYHAVSVIADAMAKGIKGFDYEKAYAAAKHSAELNHFGLAAYKKRGYISMEDENESVSKTLEYAYDDWCIAMMAKVLIDRRLGELGVKLEAGMRDKYVFDKAKESIRYGERSEYFQNLYDASTGFFRPKKNGGFVEPFAPNEVTFGFTEGNSWQYSFFVPHHVSRLMQLMGGREKFIAKLDELFTTTQKLGGREQADLTGLIGQYAHGNEPSHHIAYLYNYAREPWKTQKYVRRIMDDFYKPTPDGLIGNEDCGQMSAWYIMSALGIYEVAPGAPDYAFGTPLFKQAVIHLENGKTFTIKALNVSDKNFYVRSAKLNGARTFNSYINHADLMKGGTLEVDMSPTPVENAFEFAPLSMGSPGALPVPVIDAGGRVFNGSTTVMLSTLEPAKAIQYRLDDGDWKIYKAPFTIDKTARIQAVSLRTDAFPMTILPEGTHVAEATLIRKPNDWTVKVLSGFSRQYTGGGDNAIVDGIRGTTNFASGEWQGVQGKPYEAVIDLKRPTEIRELGASFLQVAGPWIWMPDRIEFDISSDGVNFTKAVEIKPNFPQREMTPTVKEFTALASVSGRPISARYVRIRAFNFGKIPDWHLGAGGDPWIFIDEVVIQ